jgi:hypothetical protein
VDAEGGAEKERISLLMSKICERKENGSTLNSSRLNMLGEVNAVRHAFK